MEKETEHPHYLGTKWRVLFLKPRPGLRSWSLEQESRVPDMPDSGRQLHDFAADASLLGPQHSLLEPKLYRLLRWILRGVGGPTEAGQGPRVTS